MYKLIDLYYSKLNQQKEQGQGGQTMNKPKEESNENPEGSSFRL